jgi:hypothetical protein
MKSRFALLVALSISALSLAGCGGDDDDDGTSPTGGGGGSGEAITSANIGAVQSTFGSTLAAAMAKGPGTHKGAKSGEVKITLSTGKAAQIGLAVKYKVEFDDYSDDGVNYLDGTINYEISGTNIKYTGDITLSGAYSGRIKINVSVTNGVASGTYEVNGQSFSI